MPTAVTERTIVPVHEGLNETLMSLAKACDCATCQRLRAAIRRTRNKVQQLRAAEAGLCATLAEHLEAGAS